MSKRFVFLMVFLTLLSSNILAVDKTFTNADAGDNSWNLAGNWAPAGAPVLGDRVFILGDSAGAIGPKIDNDVNIGTAGTETGNCFFIGNGGTQTALLTVNSGNIFSGPVYIGKISHGIMTFNGGTWNSASSYKTWNIGITDSNTGVLNMNSGTVYTGELILKGTGSKITMAGGKIYTSNDIEVHAGTRIDLNGGVIEQINTPFGY